jgi:hypothetical protein
MSKGWIGVDLDGTLAKYAGWVSETHIGAPVPKMLARVKTWLAAGEDVRIFTARANPGGRTDAAGSKAAIEAIQEWCRKYVGRKIPVTYEKDYAMKELWDDRAVQVVPNTGERADGAQ